MKNWKPNSWRKYPVKHVPSYESEKELNQVLNKIKSFPPLVFAGETRHLKDCLLYTSPSPRDKHRSRMPSSA